MVLAKTVTSDLTSKLGQNIDADGVYGSQCVDTINYVLKKYFNISLWGNAIDLPQSAKAKGLTWIDNEVGNVNSKPQEGDFFVMDTTNLYGHPYGHTGYVVSSDGYTMVTYETNVDGNADSLTVGGPLRKLNRDFAGVIGWFRPKYDTGSSKPSSTPKPSSNKIATKNVNGDLFSGLITDVDPNIMNSDSNRVTIDRIILHHNAGTSDEGARRTWYVSTGIGTSAHYQVTPNKIWGCVGENFVAYHAGNYGMNQRSIGIEHLNNTGAPSWTIAEATYLNSAKLIADICTRYNIPVDRKHILKHGEVSSTQCPGGIDVDRLVRMAKDIVNGSSSQTTVTNSGVPNLGGEGMSFTFQIKGDKGWNAGTIYYYNAYTNEIRGFHNPEELKWTQIVFKETTGRELKHYVWNTSAPVYSRVFSALQPKRY